MEYNLSTKRWTSSNGIEYIIVTNNDTYHDTLYDSNLYTEEQAIKEHKEMLVRKEIKNLIRSIAHRLDDEGFYAMKDDLSYIFTEMLAYGDESYYINTSNGKYYSTWFYIGD